MATIAQDYVKFNPQNVGLENRKVNASHTSTNAYQPNACKTRTGINTRNLDTARRHELESAALAYAARGLYVVPLHTPLFDSDGKCCGCTCEAWKRSAKYQKFLEDKGLRGKFDPNFTCRTPGKHPRLKDWEAEASKDPEQIRTWWRKWPTANIGLAVGKSDKVTFDLDSYKKVYGDDSELFTREDKQTATQQSGGGGWHLVFQMPIGKAYTNANNTLPAGVDIRGVGGMQVVAPSMHPSGNLYQWEEGYSILEMAARPLPARLAAILDAAQAASAPAKAVIFTTPTTERPSFLQWRISKPIRALIDNPPARGERSEADYKVCLSLVYAGATDDEIRGVYQHCTIGTAGKYAESGDHYLAITIGKARTFAETHPRPDVKTTIAHSRLWIKTHSFADYLPAEFKQPRMVDVVGDDGEIVKEERPWQYLTDRNDTKLADAVLDAMEKSGMLTVNVGQARLAKLAGISSKKTVRAILARLSGWLFEVTPNAQGAQITLCDLSRLHQIAPLLETTAITATTVLKGGQFDNIDINEYSPHKADDAFASGISAPMRDRFARIAQALEVTVKEAKQIDTTTIAGCGETILRLKDAHARCGDMTASEAAAETGKTLSAIRAAYRKMEAYGLVEAQREGPRGPKVYSIIPDFWSQVEKLTPDMRTHGLLSQRENKRLESAQQWTQAEAKKAAQAGETEKAEELKARFKRQAEQRLPHLTSLHPDLSLAEIEDLAYRVADYKRSHDTTVQIRTERTAQRTEHRDDVTMIRELADEIADIDTTRSEVFNGIMKSDLWPASLVTAVLQSPIQMRNYETTADLRKRSITEGQQVYA